MHKPFINVIIRKFAIFALAFTAMAQYAQAQQTVEEFDFTAPILIDSEKQHIDLKENKTVFDGNVIVTQGTMSMRAQKLLAYRQNEKGKEVFVATGKPATYKRTLSNGKKIVAQADKIRYEVETRALVLTGNAQLTQNDSLVKSKTIRYDLTKQTVEAEGSVQSIFNTDSKDDNKGN